MATSRPLSGFALLASALLFLGGLFTTFGAIQLAQGANAQSVTDPFSFFSSSQLGPGFNQGSTTMLSGWLLLGLGGLVGLGSWLTAVIQALQQRRWGWVVTLVLASLLLDLGAAALWFPLFPMILRLVQQSVLTTPLLALALALLPLPVLGWGWTQRRQPAFPSPRRRPYQF
jgi:hypothetical protein